MAGDSSEMALLSECRNKFQYAISLIDKSKFDPENEPFKSRYEAATVLEELRQMLENALKKPSSSDGASLATGNNSEERSESVVLEKCSTTMVTTAYALVQYHISLNNQETEQFTQALSAVCSALSQLDSSHVPPTKYNVSLLISCWNQAALLTSSKDDYSQANTYLNKACTLYKTWKSENKGLVPHTCDHVLKADTEDESKLSKIFESLHTTSLYLLAQVVKNVGDKHKSTLLCYLTLKRVLSESENVDKPDLFDWALNCATLSQCFATDEMYTEANACLNASYRALEKCKQLLSVEKGAADDSDLKEKTAHCYADVDRCCVKYAINLLNSSWSFQNIPEQSRRSRYKDAISSIEDLTFYTLNVEEALIDFEKEFCEVRTNLCDVASSQVEDFEQARQVFLFGQSKCNQAKLFFTEDTYCRDYLELVRDHSQLFRELTHFEPDLKRRISMNKKRTKLLTDALKDLNPVHYIQVIRQLQFELGETYSDISDLHKELSASERNVSLEAAKKINTSINKAIYYFKQFILTFYDDKTTSCVKIPDKLMSMYIRPFLMSYFYMARLHSKLIVPHDMKVKNVEVSGGYYKMVAEYCESHSEAMAELKSEYPICKEMAMLTDAKKSATMSGVVV